MTVLRAPFPWFGGKSRVAHLVWERFGDVRNYVEPFFGSGAVLLGRPTSAQVETVNDRDAYLANFWRAVSADPEAVAHHADWPVNEADLHARHRWLVQTARERAERCSGDPEYYDARIAGWWVWGLCAWIGTGWCKPIGAKHANGTRREIDWNQRPDLSSPNGRGSIAESTIDVPHKRPALTGNGPGVGVHRGSLSRQVPHLSTEGQGVNAVGVVRQMPHLANDGRGVNAPTRQLPSIALGGERRVLRPTLTPTRLTEYFVALADRLRRVRVCCGDFERILGPAVTTEIGTTGVFLDPPYPDPGEDRATCYSHDDGEVWWRAYQWAITNGENPQLRIALCGYQRDSLTFPDGWSVKAWKAAGGYGGRTERGQRNARRERIWFSPHCTAHHQHDLLEAIP